VIQINARHSGAKADCAREMRISHLISLGFIPINLAASLFAPPLLFTWDDEADAGDEPKRSAIIAKPSSLGCRGG
jgi:hypothetical protein